MTTHHNTTSPAAGDSFESGLVDDGSFETMRADAVLGGRAVSSG